MYKGYYLVEVIDGIISSYDGQHSHVNSVEKALYLWSNLGLTKSEASYFMIKLPKDMTAPNLSAGNFKGFNNNVLLLNSLLSSNQISLKDVSFPSSPKVNKEMLGVMKKVIKKDNDSRKY